MTQLPGSEWRISEGLKSILAALSVDGQVPYAVGGAVRDSLLGLPVSDVDLATPLLPNEVMERLESAGIKAIPTGIDHGTVTAVAGGKNYEITTFRRDVATDGRRATVAFSGDWREDARRRDFTINALYADVDSGEVLDCVDGLDDLNALVIRFIGEASERIAEDHLRILRYFRFLARFGQDQVDAGAFDACKAAAAKLQSLSRERIADELLKLLGTDDPRFAVNQMVAADIFSNIVSKIDSEAAALLEQLIAREKAFAVRPSALRRLVALLPKDAASASKIAKNLRLSKKLQQAVTHRLVIPAKAGIQPTKNSSNALDSGFCRNDENVSARAIPALAYYQGGEAARDIALLFSPDTEVAACLKALEGWQKPIFPIKGGDLIAMGMEPGPAVAETLAKVEEAWIEEGFPGEEWIQEYLRENGTTFSDS